MITYFMIRLWSPQVYTIAPHHPGVEATVYVPDYSLRGRQTIRAPDVQEQLGDVQEHSASCESLTLCEALNRNACEEEEKNLRPRGATIINQWLKRVLPATSKTVVNRTMISLAWPSPAHFSRL